MEVSSQTQIGQQNEESHLKLTSRNFVLGFTGTIQGILALAGLFFPAKAFGEDNLSIVILSNLRAFTAAEVALSIFALYTLVTKKNQDAALIFVLLTVVGWTIGQVLSLIIDGSPNTFTIVTIFIQALFIPLTLAGLKGK